MFSWTFSKTLRTSILLKVFTYFWYFLLDLSAYEKYGKNKPILVLQKQAYLTNKNVIRVSPDYNFFFHFPQLSLNFPIKPDLLRTKLENEAINFRFSLVYQVCLDPVQNSYSLRSDTDQRTVQFQIFSDLIQ